MRNAMRSMSKEQTFDFDYFLQGINSSLDESVQGMKYAKSFKNFCISKGVLSTGLGVSALKFYSTVTGTETPYNQTYTGNPLALYCYPCIDQVSSSVRSDCLVIYTSAKKLYYLTYVLPYRTFHELLSPTFEVVPSYLYYIMPDRNPVMMFCSPLQPLTIFDIYNDYSQVQDAPQVTSLCNHNDRIFAVKNVGKTSVWFSDETDPTDWEVSSTGAGEIAMNDMLGDCKKVISFKGYVFVFREYGITRISAYAEQENFVVQNVYESSNYIYSNTACVCGDVIIFLATDGVYSFNGVSVRKLNVGFEKLLNGIDQSHAKGVQFKNSYYLICNTSLANVLSACNCQNTVLKYDYLTGNYEFLASSHYLDIEKINSSGIEKLACIELSFYASDENYTTRISQIEQSGAVYDTNTTKEWVSPSVDLGVSNYSKNIYAISLQTQYDCDVTIITENGEQTVHFAGSSVVQKKQVYACGVMVQIKISTTEKQANISHPVIYYKLGLANV